MLLRLRIRIISIWPVWIVPARFTTMPGFGKTWIFTALYTESVLLAFAFFFRACVMYTVIPNSKQLGEFSAQSACCHMLIIRFAYNGSSMLVGQIDVKKLQRVKLSQIKFNFQTFYAIFFVIVITHVLWKKPSFTIHAYTCTIATTRFAVFGLVHISTVLFSAALDTYFHNMIMSINVKGVYH